MTCTDCLKLARDNLGGIRELALQLPEQSRSGRQAFHTHDGVPGGDATVMLSPAATSWPNGQAEPVRAELPLDVRPPLDVLAYWSNLWRLHTRNPTEHVPTLGRVIDHLDRTLSVMADEQLFALLAHDLGSVLRQIENVVHGGDRPDVSRVPCWDCGTRLQKVWADREDADSWWCPVCGEDYDQGRYERAKHDHLHSRGADHFVQLMDAVAVTGRPEQTVRGWVRDGLVETQRGASGRLEVWWPDVRDLHRIAAMRQKSKRAGL
jgi:hypothetical protein